MELTKHQQARVRAAREALGAEHGYDAMSLAGHCGRLEWHLKEMLWLAGELAEGAVPDQGVSGPGSRAPEPVLP